MERGLHTQLDPTFPEGGPTSSLTLPRDLGWGVQPPGWPYPGTWLGGSWEEAGSKIAFFLLFPRKKAKKKATKKQKKSRKKTKKKRFGRTPPSRRGGPPKFPATFTTFPDGAAKSAKFPPNLAKVHVPRRLVTIRGILFHLQACKLQKWDDILSESDSKCFLLFFSNCFFFAFLLLFYCLFVCFFFAFLFAFFCFFFNRCFFAFFKMAKSLFFLLFFF